MRHKIAIGILVICLSSSFAIAQVSLNMALPFRDLIFPQVAAGGGLQSLLTLTNRGTAAFNGTASFFTFAGNQVQPWNPIVNGTQITAGEISVSIASQATVSYTITGSNLQVGGMVLSNTESSLSLTNYIEGNLTYFITSGNTVIDSIGVLPATPFLLTSLPFTDFSGIALALFNPDFLNRTANITVRLYDQNSNLVGTYGPTPFLYGQQYARYLKEIFPSVSSLTTGRVEIQSDIPISGIAVTQTTSGQFSSLPLVSTIYTQSASTQGVDVGLAAVALWSNGPIVEGYLIAERNGITAVFLTYGQLSGDSGSQTLTLHFDGNSAITQNHQIFGFIQVNSFTWDSTSATGTYWVAIPDLDRIESGSFSATR
jgi:hypothetical protein